MSARMRGHGNTGPDTPPAFTVDKFGPIIECRDGQWYRDGVPFEPDPPPISDDLMALVGSSDHHGDARRPDWGQTITIPEEPRDAFAAAEMEKGRRFHAIAAEYAAFYEGALREAYNAMLAAQARRRPPRWARFAGAAITTAILLAAIRDGLRR